MARQHLLQQLHARTVALPLLLLLYPLLCGHLPAIDVAVHERQPRVREHAVQLHAEPQSAQPPAYALVTASAEGQRPLCGAPDFASITAEDHLRAGCASTTIRERGSAGEHEG